MPRGPDPRPSTAALLLDLVRTAGTISRVELAGLAWLTAGTITNVVRGPIQGGLVHEVGRARAARGTPQCLIQINPETAWKIGLAAVTLVNLFDLDTVILASRSRAVSI
jgi:hypothetical protein